MQNRTSRRNFIKTAALGLGAYALSGSSANALGAESTDKMKYRILGTRTGLKVSEIGLGGYAIGDPDVIHYAVDKGINYIDTANDYRGGRSELTIGKVMNKLRQKVVLTTKWHPWSRTRKDEMMRSLNTSLKRLQTDHVDVLLVHQVGRVSGGESIARLQNDELYEAYEQAKRQGKVRFAGVSGHDGDLMEVMDWVINKGYFDVILMRYNFIRYEEQRELIKKAKSKGIGVIAMKTLSGAKGENDPKLYRKKGATYKQAALKWVLANEDVSNLIITISSRTQVDEYAKVPGMKLTQADMKMLEYYKMAYKTEVCTMCNECEPHCPKHLPVAEILRYSMYAENYHLPEQGSLAYQSLALDKRASDCATCPAPCIPHCPEGVDIKREMEKAHEILAPREGIRVG